MPTLAEGVLLIDAGGMIQFANPAAATMTGYDSSTMLTGLDYSLILRLESADGAPIEISKTDRVRFEPFVVKFRYV